MIHYYSHDINFTLKHKRTVSNWIKEIIVSHNRIVGSINFIFTNDSYLLEMNKKYLSHNYYTDVITFDTSSYSDSDNSLLISGDVFISVDSVNSNASIYNQSFSNEMYRVIIHAILHLIGFDDLSDSQQKEMTKQENIALSKLLIND